MLGSSPGSSHGRFVSDIDNVGPSADCDGVELAETVAASEERELDCDFDDVSSSVIERVQLENWHTMV